MATVLPLGESPSLWPTLLGCCEDDDIMCETQGKVTCVVTTLFPVWKRRETGFKGSHGRGGKDSNGTQDYKASLTLSELSYPCRTKPGVSMLVLPPFNFLQQGHQTCLSLKYIITPLHPSPKKKQTGKRFDPSRRAWRRQQCPNQSPSLEVWVWGWQKRQYLHLPLVCSPSYTSPFLDKIEKAKLNKSLVAS